MLKTECPHKWVSIYITDWTDYECKLCGQNLFDTYGKENFWSGELKVEDFYVNKKQLVNWSNYRILEFNHKFIIQVKNKFLWWTWWTALKETNYDDMGNYSTLLEFNSFDKAIDYLVESKVNSIKRLL